MANVTYNGLEFEPYITRDQIAARVQELGKAISADFAGKRPLMLCVLTGAFPFASDLFRELDLDAEISFIRLKSYDGMSTTGKVKEIMGLTEDLSGRHVIIVEDIIDTGKTMSKLIEDVRDKGAASVSVATLLFKPDALQYKVNPDYVGFNIPSKFIIGYGLDLDGLARNLKDIYSICNN